MTGFEPCRVAPFGDLRIIACLPLPEAFRSLPRPSSPHGTKASIMRPYTLGRNQNRFDLRRLHEAPSGVHVRRSGRRFPTFSKKNHLAMRLSKSVGPEPWRKRLAADPKKRGKLALPVTSSEIGKSKTVPSRACVQSLCTGRVVGVPGIEPGTSSLSGTRSNQLSYTPFAEV